VANFCLASPAQVFGLGSFLAFLLDVTTGNCTTGGSLGGSILTEGRFECQFR
jgi:hypothetical protein